MFMVVLGLWVEIGVFVGIVLKIGPDRQVRPVQPGTGTQFGPVKSPKTDKQPKNRPKTGV